MARADKALSEKIKSEKMTNLNIS